MHDNETDTTGHDGDEEDEEEEVHITIVRSLIKKPELGGWRHICTGTEYLNGDSQTGPPPRRLPPEKTCSRLSQTMRLETGECQTDYDQATQMWREDCYIASVSDKYITAKEYESYEQRQIRLDLDGKARIIQKCWRAYRFIQFVKRSAELYRKLREECEALEREKDQERRERYQANCRTLNHPRTLAEHDGLLTYMEEVGEHGKHLPDDLSPRCRALGVLEARRRAFVMADEKLREARDAQVLKRKIRFLDRHRRPVTWRDRKGRIIEMLTLRNQLAMQYWAVYELISNDEVAAEPQERIDALNKAKDFVYPHYCRPINFFRALVDEEIDMITKGVEYEKLQYFRKRVIGAFLQFTKTSHNCTCKSVDGNGCVNLSDFEFSEPLKKDRLYCTSCRKLQPRDKFPVTVRKLQSNKCKACLRLYGNVRRGHIDLRPYTVMLVLLRDSEPSQSLADCLSPSDLYHLIVDIWHGRSVISECADAQELRLPRYWLDQPWSPWNCVLLTQDEAEAHRGVGGGDKLFATHLRRKIRTAHSTAAFDFRNLLSFMERTEAEKLDESLRTEEPIKIDVGCGCDRADSRTTSRAASVQRTADVGI